ncbi:MAG: TerB family tellurite resistance protein [Deltaproteobacteria bacterium]
MLSVFKKFFDGSSGNAGGMEKEDRGAKLRTATCVLLLEAATADNNFSPEEQKKVIEILQKRFQMSDTEVGELIDESKKAREDATDLWYFTNLINESLTKEEKYDLMELVWEVIYSDGTLDKFENYIAHKLFNMLRIDHSKFIELKMKVKNEYRIT